MEKRNKITITLLVFYDLAVATLIGIPIFEGVFQDKDVRNSIAILLILILVLLTVIFNHMVITKLIKNHEKDIENN